VGQKVYQTFEEVVRDIPDGASILIPGFGPGVPLNLLRALYHQGAKNLTLIANGAGGPATPGRENTITSGTLVEAGRVRKVILAFTGATHPSRPSVLEELQETGRIEAELTPQGSLAERIRAGGAGIPAFYTPAGVGTEIAKGKEHRVFNGRTYILEEAITADYAFIRAWRADTFGNLIFRRAQRNFNPIMATAARCTIVEVEEPIASEGELDPDQVHTPGIFVHRIVKIPPPPEGILHAGPANAAPAQRPAPASR
jgi:3-oxoacid CoA-transferase A subunit